MQQLKDEWKIALYELLDSNKYMIMVGDYNQEIRPKDQKEYEEDDDIIILENDEKDNMSYYLGDIKFKKMILNRNYRNTRQITNVINKLVKQIEKIKKDINYTEKNQNKNLLKGISSKNGEVPEYIYAMNEDMLKQIIKNKILYLIEEKGIDENDIILLYPGNYFKTEQAKKNNKACGKLSKASIEKIICNELKLQFNDLTDGTSKVNNTGIKLSTIGKSIGLDFKAVIIFGLYNIRSSKKENIEFTDIETIKKSSINVKRELINNMKNIYVAASRAKEYLYIIDDIDGATKNLISEYVKKIGEKNE